MKKLEVGQTVKFKHKFSTPQAVKEATIKYVVDGGRGLVIEVNGKEQFMLTDFIEFT